MHLITDILIRQATDAIFNNWYGRGGNRMSIALPTSKEEKRKRLIMLVRQGSITIRQSQEIYADYCRLYDIESCKDRVQK